MNKLKVISAAILMAIASTSVMAQDSDVMKDWGLSLKAGTAGMGLDVTKKVTDNWKVRAGFSDFKYDDTYTQDQVDYEGQLRLGGWNLLADWHPNGGGWRVSGGVFGPSHKLSGSGKINGGITINGRTYDVLDLGRVDFESKWSGIKPYLGVGYDGFNNSSKGGMYFSADVGVVFAGSPKVSLTANCLNPLLCSAIEADRAAEESKIRNDLKDFKYLPVVQVGIGYRF